MSLPPDVLADTHPYAWHLTRGFVGVAALFVKAIRGNLPLSPEQVALVCEVCRDLPQVLAEKGLCNGIRHGLPGDQHTGQSGPTG